jgi:DNA-binding cell septation regulator SpoVG
MKVIKLNLNVSKITKEKLVKGEKGLYLNCALIETPNSEYSDYMIVEEISKEEREAGQKGEILGNGKVFEGGGGKPSEDELTDLPF